MDFSVNDFKNKELSHILTNASKMMLVEKKMRILKKDNKNNPSLTNLYITMNNSCVLNLLSIVDSKPFISKLDLNYILEYTYLLLSDNCFHLDSFDIDCKKEFIDLLKEKCLENKLDEILLSLKKKETNRKLFFESFEI